MDTDPLTIVIFRTFRDGAGVIAIFPEIPGTDDPYTCSSFMHVGQHAAADPQVLAWTTAPATEEQYADLRRELESPPYNYRFVVRKRLSRRYLAVRRAALKTRS